MKNNVRYLRAIISLSLLIIFIFLLYYFFHFLYAIYNHIPTVNDEREKVTMSTNEIMNTRFPAKNFFFGERAEMGEAIYQNDILKVDTLLKQGINVDQLSENNDGFTYLMYAIFLEDRQKITRLLLEAGANPNIVSDVDFPRYQAEGISSATASGRVNYLPLYFETQIAPIEDVHLLLKYGADPNQILEDNNQQYTVLLSAVRSMAILDRYESDLDSINRIKLLLEYGLDIKKQTQIAKITNPICGAYNSSHIDTVLFILDNGGDATACGEKLVAWIDKDLQRKINPAKLLDKKRVLLERLKKLGYE
ncbi:ankyrin repeat domain-containing protein [Pasteurella testudinis]|nr:ankyrin repeat domain-containing protein [Pasteurella testudinis]SUB52170.1 Ankyrin repeats (3 copies) [Pasteurella testudinis]